MYYKKVNYNSDKEMFEFLTNHFEYDTINSWNGCRSIAHNVKVYNIPDLDSEEALKVLEEDNYFSINRALEDWATDHPGYEVGFNGRSGGYLVLYKTGTCKHALITDDSDSPCNYRPQDYEAWKNDIRNDYSSLKNYHNILVRQVKLVQEFDQLCDDLVALTKSLIEEMHKRESLTRSYSTVLRFQRYYYDTVEDMKLHMLDMKRRGYSVWEYSDSDEEAIYAEYEMNESIHSEITLEEDEALEYEK